MRMEKGKFFGVRANDFRVREVNHKRGTCASEMLLGSKMLSGHQPSGEFGVAAVGGIVGGGHVRERVAGGAVGSVGE